LTSPFLLKRFSYQKLSETSLRSLASSIHIGISRFMFCKDMLGFQVTWTKVFFMSRKSIKTAVLKRVFAFSGNQCAYKNCKDSLFEEDLFVGELAHICSASAGGPRHNPDLSDDEIRAQKNLILLCHRHHRVVDAFPDKYTVAVLETMKSTHEAQFGTSPLILDTQKTLSVIESINTYWNDVLTIGLKQNQVHGLARIINKDSDEDQLISEVQESLDRSISVIRDTNKVLHSLDNTVLPFLQKNGFVPDEQCPIKMFDLGYGFNRINWEIRNIGGENFYQSVSFALLQLQVKIAELKVLISPDDDKTCEHLDLVREQLTIAAEQAHYVD